MSSAKSMDGKPGLTIRLAELDDIPLLLQFRTDYISATFESSTQDQENAILKQLRSYYDIHLRNGSLIALIAFLDGVAAACAFLLIEERPANPTFLNGKVGILMNVFTYPEFRKQGIATQVLKKVIRIARENRVSRIDLKSTEAGKKIYQELGFQDDNEYSAMSLSLFK